MVTHRTRKLISVSPFLLSGGLMIIQRLWNVKFEILWVLLQQPKPCKVHTRQLARQNTSWKCCDLALTYTNLTFDLKSMEEKSNSGFLRKWTLSGSLAHHKFKHMLQVCPQKCDQKNASKCTYVSPPPDFLEKSGGGSAMHRLFPWNNCFGWSD